MKQGILFIITVSLSVLSGKAQSGSVLINASADSSWQKASVIKRSEIIELLVESENESHYKVDRVYTILNEAGKDHLLFNEYSSRRISLQNPEVKVFDAFGNVKARYRKKDMQTVATGEGLIEDGTVTYFNVPAPSYPVTVEFSYEIDFHGTLVFPAYRFYESGVAIEKSSFTAKIARPLELRYKEYKIKLPPAVSEEGKYKVYRWTVEQLPPLAYEEGAASYSNRYPCVLLAPHHFSWYNREGDMSSWSNYGKWIAQLYEGQDELPEDKIAYFKDLVKDKTTVRDKAAVLYQYLQDHFRYVSIQLGIGGLRPFSASFTDEKKYGDCKALSNYMKAALKAVGINSYVAIINSQYNSEPVDPLFPSNNAFDHVILCIPNKGDSIWLECTSNSSDFGKLGTFTENRNALLITENGGKLVPTPQSNAKDHLLVIKNTLQLAEDASGTCETDFFSTGYYKEMIDYLMKLKQDDQKNFIVNGLGYKSPDEFKMEMQESDNAQHVLLHMQFEKVPQFSVGSKMFLSTRPYELTGTRLPTYKPRKFDYYFHNPYVRIDTTVYKLPAGFKPDVLPKPKRISCPYADYQSKIWFDEGKAAVICAARLELKQHHIPASQYDTVKQFFDQVLLEDEQRIVIQKE